MTDYLQRMAYGVAPQLRTRSACCKKYCFDLALDIQVVANTFSLPLASYSDSIHESELYLPYDVPARQPLPEIMYFVHGNHFQTIRTKQFPRMIWPPVSPKSLEIWESRGRDPKLHKAAWKCIHREKHTVAQNSDENGKNPMTLEGDGGKPQIKKDELEELNELPAAADAIELETETMNACPYCGTLLGDPIPNSIKKMYAQYILKNEQFKETHRKNRERKLKQGSTSRRTLCERTPERKVAFEEQLEFCLFHKIELIYKQEGMKKGYPYPTEINFKSLPRRILSHLDTLVKIVKGLLYSSFRINEEEFVQENERVIIRKNVSCGVLYEWILWRKRESDHNELTFIQTILVPECSILLIQEDLSIPSYKDAFNILMSSHEYGLHVYPNPVEEDYND
ncbi:hypothetical protein INT45_007764 [Circinella minor]|uniref:Restriction of telomere capping protein 4 n=1 Tax=Circinella minor TaxID=1195481 RepID=A0A8H7RPY7_9FUNG|nr:hypothetical protein INT45_007764 [Circinella minor]